MRAGLFTLTNGTKQLRYVDTRMTPEGFLREYANEDWWYVIVKLRGKVRRIVNDKLKQFVLNFD